MYTEWTKHLKTPEEKEKWAKTVFASKEVLDYLNKLLEEKEKYLDRSEMDIAVYDTPSWAYRQAHKNGNRESLHYLRKLINLDQQKVEKL